MECYKIVIGIICVIFAICYRLYVRISKHLPRPTFDLKEYWGKGEVKDYKEDISIKPFKISYSDEVKKKIISRLKINKLTDYQKKLTF